MLVFHKQEEVYGLIGQLFVVIEVPAVNIQIRRLQEGFQHLAPWNINLDLYVQANVDIEYKVERASVEVIHHNDFILKSVNRVAVAYFSKKQYKSRCFLEIGQSETLSGYFAVRLHLLS
ncbi:hypothetical protein SS50377_20409 [Spironucleus salmonicida]|uniref:Uncharacterized protein n=1 Tax=Spironucleus salmonicida TaxID=348837 RepID=A0A9P8LZC1_9EUKA|nr:hypothetical protein SS50377_20409 [Spironucleus salmonicida]